VKIEINNQTFNFDAHVSKYVINSESRSKTLKQQLVSRNKVVSWFEASNATAARVMIFMKVVISFKKSLQSMILARHSCWNKEAKKKTKDRVDYCHCLGYFWNSK
jgi:hypothetical protein